MRPTFQVDPEAICRLPSQRRADSVRDETSIKRANVINVKTLVQPDPALDRAALGFRSLEVTDREADDERPQVSPTRSANPGQHDLAQSGRLVATRERDVADNLFVLLAQRLPMVDNASCRDGWSVSPGMISGGRIAPQHRGNEKRCAQDVRRISVEAPGVPEDLEFRQCVSVEVIDISFFQRRAEPAPVGERTAFFGDGFRLGLLNS